MRCENGVCYLNFDEKVQSKQGFNAESYVTNLIQNHPIVMFSKDYCPYCVDAKKQLEQITKLPIEAPQLDLIENGKLIHGYVKKLTHEPTVPNIFIYGRWIGGHEDLVNHLATGKLQTWLAQEHKGPFKIDLTDF